LLLTQLQRNTAPLRTTLDVGLAYIELLRERSRVDHAGRGGHVGR
jgi:hypothetical protein